MSPEGTVELVVISRPFGTLAHPDPSPSVETLGYSQPSLLEDGIEILVAVDKNVRVPRSWMFGPPRSVAQVGNLRHSRLPIGATPATAD